MIRNERQFKVAKRQHQMLTDELQSLLRAHASEETTEGNAEDNLVIELQRASLEGQIADLAAQLHEYEALRSGGVARTTFTTLSALPDALIKARIAAGLSQRDLAERLGMKEQQIQRYESEAYASASVSRLEEVRLALDVDLAASVELSTSGSSLSKLRARLRRLGFDRNVIERRLLRDLGSDASTPRVLAMAERAARVLGIAPGTLLSDETPLPALAITTARFKAPRNAAEGKLHAYARYAEGIARIVARATAHLGDQMPVPTAEEFRETVTQFTRSVQGQDGGDGPARPATSAELFKATLGYLSTLRIPVIPLRDAGAFHGACFTIDGRSVIVLKQTTEATGYWLNDLLHEAAHIADPDRDHARSWIELGEISQWTDAPEEQRANAFAADVLFEGRAEAVLSRCLLLARGSVERLKGVVPTVAHEAEVASDVLAAYLAFQLSEKKINWWGTAASFQDHGTPWRVVVDELLVNLDFSALDHVERAALMDALST